MYKQKINNSLNNIVVVVFMAVVLTAGAFVGGYFLYKHYADREYVDVPITSVVTFRDANSKFNLSSSDGVTNLSFNLTAGNEAEYMYANIYAAIPDVCYRYDTIYLKFKAQNVNSVVLQVGSVLKTVDVVEGENAVSIKVSDWGLVPRLLIFPDTHGVSLADNYAASKVVTILEIGFCELV